MAMVSPLSPSPTTDPASTSKQTPIPGSPPASLPANSPPGRSMSDNLAPPPSPYPQHFDPSPTDSNGTEGTEIDEDAQEDHASDSDRGADKPTGDGSIKSTSSTSLGLSTLVTTLSSRSRSNSDDAPPSVIHAPSGFSELRGPNIAIGVGSPSERTVGSPSTPNAAASPSDSTSVAANCSDDTDVSSSFSRDRATPRAQQPDATPPWHRQDRRLSSSHSDTQVVGESSGDRDHIQVLERSSSEDTLQMDMTTQIDSQSGKDSEVVALRKTLSECWTLCNSLASLSSIHRQKAADKDGQLANDQEQAWRSCWYLCQHLYDSQLRAHYDARPTLRLCRDFCQALFDVRQRGDEALDSVLRVSFEMNNHLYHIHDRSLPDSFRERTLEFYVTFCHRLMKQRTTLQREQDALMRACWALAEQLFNLRQTARQSCTLDEELLGSAVQACWELCDLFREGWAQIRPDRSTPRPGQSKFPTKRVHSGGNTSNQSERPASSLSSSSYHDAPSLPPETPTTIFDDTTTASSPESATVPNILVLGPAASAPPNGVSSNSARGTTAAATASYHDRWSSNASTLSDFSESSSSVTSTSTSQRTSSTATQGSESSYLVRLRYLLLRAALNAGYTRTSPQAVPAFAKALAATAFGALPWQMQVLGQYKTLLLADASLHAIGELPSKKLTAKEVAKAVVWLGKRRAQWAWMRDLYLLVFGFGLEDAERVGGVIQV